MNCSEHKNRSATYCQECIDTIVEGTRQEKAKEIFKELEVLIEELEGVPWIVDGAEHQAYYDLKAKFLKVEK